MTTQRHAWLADLFAEHSGRVRAYAWRRVPPDVVDDVVVEVFAIALRKGSVPEHALPWLYRTAANVIASRFRSEARRLRYEQQAAEPERVNQDVGVLDRVVVTRALADLAEPDAEILRLAYWEDLAVADIAGVLGCSTSAAKVRLHRARQRLRRVLEPSSVPPLTLVKEPS